MNSLLLLLISAVLAIVFINIIPLGLNRKEKNIVSGSSFLIGTVGITFSLIAAPWQAVLIMLLFASSVGYIMVIRSAGSAPAKGSIKLNENERLNRNQNGSSTKHETSIKPENMIIQPDGEIIIKAFPNNQILDLEEDISFLEERNKILTDKLSMTDFDDIQVINLDNDMSEEKWINELEKHEMYATSQS